MLTKLTLSLQTETISKAKKISRRKGKSLSRLVEEYLNRLSDEETPKDSLVKRLTGIAGTLPATTDWKKQKQSILTKKYGI